MNPTSPNPLTYADDPHLDRDGKTIVHPIVCDQCHGSGTVESCKRHPFSAGCACTALALPCEECTDGVVNLADCDCSLCTQVFEDLERKRILELVRTAYVTPAGVRILGEQLAHTPRACPQCGDQTEFCALNDEFTEYFCKVCRHRWEVSYVR